MIKLFDHCPGCGGSLVITEIQCPKCQLVMRGQFSTGPFAGLSDDQFTFIRAFLRARGNLTEMEKVLGISYPTIRNKLDEINAILDAPAAVAQAVESEGDDRQTILRQVASGSLDVHAALDRLTKK